MKYFQVVVCATGFLLLSAACFAANPVMIVSGSNDPQVNGTYTYDGLSGGKDSWVKGEYYLRWSDAVMGFSWNIEKPSTAAVYYVNWSIGPVPEEINWLCSFNAVDPCTTPVVTADPLPEALFVSGTVDAFLNGEYTRGLNRNGYPAYAMGDYDLYVEPAWTISWTIGKIGTAEQYYITPAYGPYVPEGGWSAGTYATGPDYVPPVVTASPLPERLYVSGTVDELVNGEYARGLNLNGCPQYSKGDYVISRVDWTAMVIGRPWSIEDTSTGNVYYDSYDESGVNVPEQGWYLGFSAGSPPSPPVVSATRLPEKYKVIGAGSTEVNGIYARSLNTADGFLVYKKNPLYFLQAGYFSSMDFSYGIVKSGTGTYYTVLADSLIIPYGGWSLNAYGMANPPFVTPYSFPWAMYLPTFIQGAGLR